jgi:transcriptional regulator with XRE-family HTH domain
MTSEELSQQLGGRLREARTQAKLTQQHVADELNITRQAVSGWEAGRHFLTVPQLYELGLLYGVSSDWLLYGMKTVPASIKPVMKQVFGTNAEPSAE